MASKYWVGGGSSTSWNATSPTNWANSDGGPGNQTAPAAGDSVFFTNASGVGASNWNVTLSLVTLDCTGFRGAVSHPSGTITISSGDLVLPTGVGGSYLATSGAFTISGTTGTQKIKSGTNSNLHLLTLSGAGGTFQLQDAFNATAAATSGIALTNGTLDCQAFAVTMSVFSSLGSLARAIQGSGPWSITSATSATPINCSGSNLTTTGWSSTITISSTHDINQSLNMAGFSWPAIVLQPNTGIGQFQIAGANTIASLTINGPNVVVFPQSIINTITNGLTVNSAAADKSKWVELINSTPSGATSQAIISSANASNMWWTALSGMTFQGGGTATALKSADCGGPNTGVTITPPVLGVSRSRLQLGA